MRRALAEKGATGAPRGQSTLDAQDVRDIFRRFDIGETQKSVAQSYGVDKSTISHILRGTTWSHLGLKRKKPIVRALTALQLAAISKLYNQGLTYSQISKEVGRPLGTIKKALKRARRGGITTHKPVPQWWVQIKALYERGLTYAQVGEKLGKSEPAVAQAAKRLGVVSRPPGTRCK
jgi:DNA invertase Pin-like site-specific DNA recombinase